MKHELIKTENYLLAVDDYSKIKDGDWCIYKTGEIIQYVVKLNTDNLKKIVAHLPLNNSPILQGVDLLPPLELEQQEDDVEKIADEYVKSQPIRNRSLTNDTWNATGFVEGYNKAKEKYKYTEEDMIKSMRLYAAWISGGTPSLRVAETAEERHKQIIQSLSQPKMPIGFECEMKFKQMPDFHKDEPKTTTNPKGQTQWVGKYIY